MEEITGTLLYIYRSCNMLEIDLSGWKGSVPHGLGADISLPPCLATGIWNLVPKATSGPKSRGASFGTKLWRHVQRYCAQFLAFMVIYDNSVLWVFCLLNRKNPKISNGNRGNQASDFPWYYVDDYPRIVRQEVLLAIVYPSRIFRRPHNSKRVFLPIFVKENRQTVTDSSTSSRKMTETV